MGAPPPPPPPPGPPPGGYPPYGQPPGQPPGGYGQPPPGGYGQPPYGAPPPGSGPPQKRSQVPLFIGTGLAVAALLVGFLATRGGDDDEPIGLPSPAAPQTSVAQPSAAPLPTEDIEVFSEQPEPEAPALTSLDGVFPEFVGPYDHGPVEEIQDGRDRGAIDARAATYSTQQGDQVVLTAQLFPTPQEALDYLEFRVSDQTASGVWEIVEDTQLTDAQGNVGGRYVLLAQAEDPDVRNVLWVNENARFGIGVPPGSNADVEAFYEDLPF